MTASVPTALAFLLTLSSWLLAGCSESGPANAKANTNDASPSNASTAAPSRKWNIDMRFSGDLGVAYKDVSWSVSGYSPPANVSLKGFVIRVYEKPMSDFKHQLDISPIPYEFEDGQALPVAAELQRHSVRVTYTGDGLNRADPQRWVGTGGTLTLRRSAGKLAGELAVDLVPDESGASASGSQSARIEGSFEGLTLVQPR